MREGEGETPEIMEKEIAIPDTVLGVMNQLSDAGFEAYIVGGCVRDSLMGRVPADWDVTTNAKPEDVIYLFPETHYQNVFGTVSVKTGSEEPSEAIVEITTYRMDGVYSDARHPDYVEYSERLEDDLSRRDFTMNAIASDGKVIIDPHNGQEDIEAKQIRAVGDPNERFSEDALRLMRAVRFATQLEFTIEDKTAAAISEQSEMLSKIALERSQDEFVKLLMSPRGDMGVELMRKHGLMKHVLPELLEGVGMEQNHHHIYTVWEHNVRALRYACEQGYSMQVRLASLLHDVGKARTKDEKGRDSTFYGHEAVGGRMVKKMLKRLRFPREDVEHISMLVTQHMFNSDVEGENAITEAGARRLVSRVGAENMDDLYRVREADRIGSGVAKAVPFRLRKFKYLVDRAMHDPISRKQLKINGNDLIGELAMEPGPRLGSVIDALFEEVLDDPKNNTKEDLLARAKELGALSDEDLQKLRESAQAKYDAVLAADDEQLKSKHRVS